jgi:PKD repeat protein
MYSGMNRSGAYMVVAMGATVVAAIVLLSLPGEEIVREDRDPVAEAGPDGTVDQGHVLTLDGSGSTDDRGVVSWAWTFEYEGAPAHLDGAVVDFTFGIAGFYVITLTVSDAAGNTASDTLTVTVVDTEPPVADAGPDLQVPVGALVALSALGSTDNVGVTGHEWAFQVEGTPVHLTGAEVAYEFTVPGIHEVTLNVTDGAGNWAVDTLAVTVFEVPVEMTFHYDFSQGAHGWEPGFADVAPEKVDDVGFASGVRDLPEYLGSTPALWYTGSNFADDLFMFFTTRLEGLAPDTEYDVVFTVGFASMWYVGQPGAGGSPADAVWIRAALAPEEFRVEPGYQHSLRIYPGVGNMSHDDGENGIPLGNIAKPDDGTADWVLLEHTSGAGSFSATADAEGNLWALFGTDSGFEGINEIYYTHLTIELVPKS